MLKQLDARVIKLFYDLHGTICGRIIRDNDLEVLKRLIEYALNAFPDKLFVVIGRNDYAYKWHYFLRSLMISQIRSTLSSSNPPYKGRQRTSLTILCATG